MENWQNRDWTPDEEQMAMISSLQGSDGGQVLLRAIDQMMLNEMQGCGFGRPGESEAVTLAELASRQGSYKALNVVKNWLLMERDSEIESQNEDEENG